MAKWVEVKSSNIEALSYDLMAQVMVVRFRNGTEYEYFDVTSATAAAVIYADSIGKAYNALLKSSGGRKVR